MGAAVCMEAPTAVTSDELQFHPQSAFKPSDAHLAPSMAAKKIEDADEFQSEVSPDEILRKLLCSRKTSTWAKEAFDRREKRHSIRSVTSEASTATSDSMLNAALGRRISTRSNEEDEEIYKLKDGRIYQGQWNDGMMHGEGVLYEKDGEKYEGTFVQGLKHGRGTLTWEDGRTYVGQFANNRPHGRGQVFGTFGETYDATAINGKMELN